MSTETNKRLVRHLMEEGFNHGNLAVADEVVAPDFTDHTSASDRAPGPEGLKQVISMLRCAFPDFHFAIEHEVAEGDLIVIRGTYRYTHKGEFFGIAPTGKRVTTTGMHLFRAANGKLVEHWCNNDDLGLMRQLGVVS